MPYAGTGPFSPNDAVAGVGAANKKLQNTSPAATTTSKAQLASNTTANRIYIPATTSTTLGTTGTGQDKGWNILAADMDTAVTGSRRLPAGTTFTTSLSIASDQALSNCFPVVEFYKRTAAGVLTLITSCNFSQFNFTTASTITLSAVSAALGADVLFAAGETLHMEIKGAHTSALLNTTNFTLQIGANTSVTLNSPGLTSSYSRGVTDIARAIEVGTSYAATVLAKTPALHWRLGASGGTDQSGNGRNATTAGGVTIGGVTGALATDTDKSTDFDGVDDVLSHATYNPFTATGVATIEMWINPATAGTRQIWRQAAGAGAGFGFAQVGQTLRVYTWGGAQVDFTFFFLTTGVWVHLVLVCDDTNNTVTVYRNGVLFGLVQNVSLVFAATTAGFQIGQTPSAPVLLWQGQIDEFALYERALTEAEAANNYNAGITGVSGRRVVLGRAQTDTASATDSLGRKGITARAQTDTASATDSLGRALGVGRTVSETATATDTLARMVVLSRAPADTAVATDAIVRTVVVARAAVDSAPATDALARSVVAGRGVADTASATDAVVRAVVTTRALVGSAPASDVVARSVIVSRFAADTASATDAAARTVSVGRGVSDSAPATDVVVRFVLTGRSLADSAPTTDAAARRVITARAIADTAPAVDSLSRTLALGRATSDSAPASDTVARDFRAIRSQADSAPATDVLVRSVIVARALSDSAQAVDSVGRLINYGRFITDNIGPTGGGTIVRKLVAIFDD
jgi:hypothetical protein